MSRHSASCRRGYLGYTGETDVEDKESGLFVKRPVQGALGVRSGFKTNQMRGNMESSRGIKANVVSGSESSRKLESSLLESRITFGATISGTNLGLLISS